MIVPTLIALIVPTLRVGMHPVTLRVTLRRHCGGTQSVQGGITMRSVGTINIKGRNPNVHYSWASLTVR